VMIQSNFQAPLNGARFLKSEQVMQTLGYTDRSAFWQAIKAAGIPFVRINSRRCIFEESAVRAWLDSRTVGKSTN
jgi:predicted DNA-binding transcriptional regulator AlpA